jgi:hypothetical protein
MAEIEPRYITIARQKLIEDLRAFFLSGDADQGLRSSWGPLSDIALGGFGGTPDPEGAITDRRFGLGLAPTATTYARLVRSALQHLAPREQSALYVAHGPTPWPRVIDAAFGRGMAIKVQKRLADLAPVALLLDEVVAGGAGAEGEHEKGRRVQWANAGGWIVALCLDKGEAAKRRCERVKRDAGALLANSERAYLAARGLAPDRRARARPETGDRRRRALDDEVAA